MIGNILLLLLLAAAPALGQAPTVTNTVPANGDPSFNRGNNLRFYADKELRGSTVTTNRFFFYSEFRPRCYGAISFNATTNRVTLNPAQSLLPGEHVFVDVTEGILNEAGTEELEPYAWSFYAAATAADGSGILYDSGQRMKTNNSAAVAIGDFDGDGDLDAMDASGDGTVHYNVYLNNGDGTFSNSQQRQSASGFPMNGTSADVDGDGDLDVLFAVQYGVVLFLNDGSGSFTKDSQTLGTMITRDVALGDLDGDGDLDAVCVNYQQADEVWTNDQGTFYLAQSFGGTLWSTGVRMADLNGDGALDVFVVTHNSADRVFTNDGHGVLSAGDVLPLSYSSMGPALGDVNGDGYIDAVCAGYVGSDIHVWTNDGTGVFSLRQTFGSAGNNNVVLGDLNGNGYLDVALVDGGSALQIWTNRGNGLFSDAGQPATVSSANDLMLGDLDGDNDLDVFLACSGPNRVLLNTFPYLQLLGEDGSLMTNGEPPSVALGTDFGSVILGFSSTHTLSLTNPGSVTVVISGTETNGTGASQFTVEGTPDNVLPREQEFFSIRFEPTSLGTHTATVTITHSGTNSPFYFYVTGFATQPLITNTTPHNAAFNQIPSTNLAADFSQPVDGSTVSSNRFLTYSAQSGYRQGSVSLNAESNRATLNPSGDFRPGELVYAQITRGVTNAAGNAEFVPYTWSFHTATETGPALFGEDGQVIGTNDSQCAALGDLNGDGWLDAFIVNDDGPDEVWTNNGAGRLSRTTQSLGTTNSQYAALGDIDHDGDLDVAVVRRDMPTLIFTNNGNAMFYDTGQAIDGGNGRHATLADFDGDGSLDLYLVRQAETSRLWLNDGSGVFSFFDNTATMASMAAGVMDVNGDGFLDTLVVAYGGNGAVFTNDGSGALYNTFQTLNAGSGRDVAMGDFNGDGWIDAFFANDNGQGNTVWFNDGTGTFYNSGQSLGSRNSRGVAVGDLDGDGDLDAFVANYGQPNRIWLNDGSGLFEDSGRRLGSGNSWHVQLGDVDGDNRLDALVANDNGPCELWLNPRPLIEVLGTNGAAIANGEAASEAKGSDFGLRPLGVPVTNSLSITNQGVVDLAITGISTTGTTISYFSVLAAPTNVAPGTVAELAIEFAPSVIGVSTATLSIVSTATNTPYLVALRGEALLLFNVTNTVPPNGGSAASVTSQVSAAFDGEADPSTITTNRFLVRGELTGYRDGTVNLTDSNRRATWDPDEEFLPGERVAAQLTWGVWNALNTAELPAHSWTYHTEVLAGSGVFSGSGQALSTNSHNAAALGDLDGDGDLDVLTVGPSPGESGVWTNDGHGTLGRMGGGLEAAYSVLDVALGDLDGDGDLDAVFAVYSTSATYSNAIWYNDGSGSFTDSGQVFTGRYASAVALGDLDGDGDLDAYVARGVSSSDHLWLNENGVLVDSGQRLGARSSKDVALGDLDGDGDLDAFVTGDASANLVWLNHGDGVFGNSANVGGSDTHGGVDLGDVDGDGDLDAYVVSRNNPDTLWLNNGDGTFTDSGQTLDATAFGSVAAFGDLDWDGDLDVVIAHDVGLSNTVWNNDGSGTFYQNEHALRPNASINVALGDIDGDGDLDVYGARSWATLDVLWLNGNPNLFVKGINGATITNGEPPTVAKGNDFGTVSNATSASHAFSITNAGPGALNIRYFITNGVDAMHFAVSNIPTRITEGTASNFFATFTPLPSVWGERAADLVFVNRSANETQMVVHLQGYGLPPMVTNVTPPNASNGAARAGNVVAQFSEPMLAATVASNTFFLHSGQSGLRRGSVALNPGGTEATLDPTYDLRVGERVFAELTTSATNEPDRAMLKPFAWSFYAAVDAGPGRFRDSEQALGSAPARSVALGDLNGDGYLDALVGNNGQPSRAWFNDGAGVLTQSVQALTSAYTYDVALGDLDSDGDLDLFAANYNQADRVWLNDGSGLFIDSGQALGSYRSQAVALGDFDGDGDQDAFVVHWAQAPRVWTNNGQAVFSDSGQALLTEIALDVAVGDLNGDGFLDVFLGAVGGNKVLTNNGFGVFSDSGQSLGDASTYSVALGDVDHDGDLDAYAVNSGEADALWLNDGQGVFTPSGQALSEAFGSGVAFGDVNADGFLDAIIANDFQQPGEVWTNNGSGTFTDSGQRLGTASSYAIALGDTDGDGDIDAFFANNGPCEVWLNDLVYYTLTGIAGTNGSIAPVGPILVAGGSTTSFVINAATYYWIDALLTNGASDAAAVQARTYTSWWMSVTADGTASVTFTEALAPLGTPELWLAGYGLTNGGASFDEAETNDTDGDSFFAWQERIADTDPTDSNDYFHVIDVDRTNSTAVVFGSSTARVYSLEGCVEVGNGEWGMVDGQTNVAGDVSGTTTLTDTNTAATKAYRVGVSLP